MASPVRTLEEYLQDLQARMQNRPDQVKEGMEIYVGLWRKAIDLGVVEPSDEIARALEKVESMGGLYKAAGEEPVPEG